MIPVEISTWFGAIQDVIVRHAGEPWTYVITGLLCWIDGFFPPLPSESIVIALSSLSAQGRVQLSVLIVVAFVGAFLGDNTAYWIGRLIPLHRIFRGDRGQKVLVKTHDLVHRRGPEVLLTARFIPVYRVAINMTAGALDYSWRKFLLIDVISTTMWLVFSVVIGLIAGSLFQGKPLLGILIGITLGLILGWSIDQGSRLWQRRQTPK